MNDGTPGARTPSVRPLSLLLVDDNPRDRELLARELRDQFGPLSIAQVRDVHEFERALTFDTFDVAVIDHQLHWSTGLEVLRRIRAVQPTCPVIMFTASGSDEVPIEAMREGLDDYVAKGVNHYARLPFAIEACLERAQQRRELKHAHSARQALAEQVAHLAAIVESSDDAIISKTLEGIITYWNAGAARLFGYSAAEMSGQSIRRIIPPELQDEEEAILMRLARGEHIDHFETERISKSGRRVAVSITISPICDRAGRIIGASKVARDITERRLAEEALRAADRRKDKFLATLAHELRNPLAPIRYATRLLEPGVPAQMAADARQMIDRQLAQMARLLDDLLDVSRVTRGVLEIRRELLDLRDVIETAVDAARPLAQAGKLDMPLQLPTTPLPVSGDAARLAQVIGNLLSNAIKFTAPGGHITVEAQGDETYAVLRVRDDGIGIPAELLPKIFELFVQGESGGGHSASGLGIGLSLARELIELHGGRIEATSAGLGQGSEFVVRLPRADEQPAMTEQVASPEKVLVLGASDVRILIVDDNVDAADALSNVLSLAGYRTHVAYEGYAALQLAELFRPAVLLLDIGLPDLSGHEVARRLRSQSWGAGMQLVAITGWGQEVDRRKSKDAGFDEHLTKPVDPQVLLQLIARMARAAA